MIAAALAITPLMASAGDASIVTNGTAFDPADTVVQLGTTVTFQNPGAIAHTVTIEDPENEEIVLDIRLEPGQGTTYTFQDTGVWRYRCKIHTMDSFDSGMVGRVAVESAGNVEEVFGGRLLVGLAGVAVEMPLADWSGITAESHDLAAQHERDFFLLTTDEALAAADPTVCFFDAAGNSLGCADAGVSDGALGAVPAAATTVQALLETGVDVTYTLRV